MPTLVALTGFEFGHTVATSLQSGVAGLRLFEQVNAPAFTTGDARATGSYAWNVSRASTGSNQFVAWYGSGGAIGASKSVVVAGAAVWFPSALPTTNMTLFDLYSNGFSLLSRVFYQSSSGRLCVRVGAGGTVAQGPVVAADTRYWLTLKYTTSTNPHTIEWQVDGVAQTTASGGTSTSSVDLFGPSSDSTEIGTSRIDDVLVSTTAADYPLAPHKVVLLTVDTSGATTEIGTANSTARYVNTTIDATHNSAQILSALAEVPPTYGATASGVAQRVSSTGDAVSVPMTSYTILSGESISGVRVLVAGYSPSAGTSNVEVRGYDGTSDTTVFPRQNVSFSNANTSPWVAAMYTPSGGWTQAKLDAFEVRLGYSNDIAPNPGAHAIYAEVAVLLGPPWDGELANTGGGQADETAVTSGNSSAGGDPWNLVTTATGAEVTYDVVNSNTWHRFATGATSGQARAEWTSASITAPMSRIYGGFWFRIPAAALGVNNTYLMRARAATVQATRISISTGAKLQIRNTSNSSAEQGAHTIVADTDYFVRYDVTVGASAAATVELYSAAGTLIETLAPTGVNFGTGAVDEVGYGIASNVSSQPAYLLRGFVSSATAWPAPPAPPAGTTPNGLAVAVTLGSPAVATTLTTAPAGIAVPVTVGTPASAYGLTAAPAGLAVPVALGSPSAAAPGASPTGVPVPVALGSPTVPSAALIPTGIAVPVAPGTPATALNRSTAPSGVAVSVAVGTPSVVVHGASPTGVAVPVATGSPGASVLIQPNGVAVPVTVGTPTAALNRAASPTGLGITAAVGVPATAYALTTVPNGLAVTVAAGTPAVGHLGAAPAGIALTLALGPPTTAYAASVGPDGIAVPMAVGTPRANNVRPTVPRPGAGTVDRTGAGAVDRPFAGFVTR